MTDDLMIVILIVMWASVVGVFLENIQMKRKLKKMNDKENYEKTEI